jgi:hypothetical protein
MPYHQRNPSHTAPSLKEKKPINKSAVGKFQSGMQHLCLQERFFKSLSAKHPQHSTTPLMLQAKNYSLACLVFVDMEKDN